MSGNPLAPTAPTSIEIQIPAESIEVGLIFRKIEQLAETKQKLKALREQRKTILENDQDYSRAAEVLGERKDTLKQAEARVLQSQEAIQLEARLSEVKEEAKEIEESLGNHLEAYNAKTGKTVLEAHGKKVYLTKKVKLASGQLALFEKENT